MAAVPRRDKPKPLDAGLVPLERALRARASALDTEAADAGVGDSIALVAESLAAEFRALADELHHW